MNKEKARATGTRPEVDGRSGFVGCPDCLKDVKESNLEAHLRKVHRMSVKDARARADALLNPPDTKLKRTQTTIAVTVVVLVTVLVSVIVYVTFFYNPDEGEVVPTDYKPIAFVTEDGWDIRGEIYAGSAEKPEVLLVHGMNEDRKAYRTFAKDLNLKGYGVMSYDSRGFGESHYRNGTFVGSVTKQDIQAGWKDIEAAMGALETRGLSNNGVIIVGASVGANNAAIYAVNDSRVVDIVLLSPGTDYQGIKPGSAISAYKGGLLLVSYEGDDVAYESCLLFESAADNAAVLDHYHRAGMYHGTGCLVDSRMRADVEDWILENS